MQLRLIFSCCLIQLFLNLGVVPNPAGPLSAQEKGTLIPVPRDTLPSKTEAVEAHLGYVTDYCLDEYGKKATGIWLGQIDIRTSKLQEKLDKLQNADAPPRWTQANLYLDQPTMVAAIEMGRRTGCKCYQDSITRYLQEHLTLLSPNTKDPYGISLHQFYDLISDQFEGEIPEALIQHHVPAWEILAKESARFTTFRIQTLLNESNQRYSAKPAPAVSRNLASTEIIHQSIALLSFAWLAERYPAAAESMIGLAVSVLKSGSQRINQATHCSANQKGLWIKALIALSDMSEHYPNDHANEERAELAREVKRSLEQATLNVESNSHETLIIPRDGSEVNTWIRNELILGEACLSAWQFTKDVRFLKVVTDRSEFFRKSIDDASVKIDQAEAYGRLIHFFQHFGRTTRDHSSQQFALRLGDEAMRTLYEPRMGMFRSREDADICDSRDGPGFLLLALLSLEGNDPTTVSTLTF